MDFAVCAVEKHCLRELTAYQSRVERVKKPCDGESVEELEDGEPAAKLPGQCPPCDTVSQDVPERVEMSIERSSPATAPRIASVSSSEEIELIFLAARGAASA